MFCPQCGTQNEDTAVHCKQCGALINTAAAPPAPQQYVQPPQYQQPPQYVQPPQYQVASPVPLQIPSYMTQAILVTLFCCLPLGIVGIFKANAVNKKIASGDIAGALADSKANKTMLWIGFGVGVVINVLLIINKLHS